MTGADDISEGRRRQRRRRSARRQHRTRRRLLLITTAALLTVTAVTAVMLSGIERHYAHPGVQEQKVSSPVADSGAGEQLPSGRVVYAYSVIPGGAHSPEELAEAIQRDPLVAAHYEDLTGRDVRLETVKEDRLVHVSYRMNDRIYWTAGKVRLQRGETVLTDGETMVRTRCGNRISDEPGAPIAASEPDLAALDRPASEWGTVMAPAGEDLAPLASGRVAGALPDSVLSLNGPSSLDPGVLGLSSGWSGPAGSPSSMPPAWSAPGVPGGGASGRPAPNRSGAVPPVVTPDPGVLPRGGTDNVPPTVPHDPPLSPNGPPSAAPPPAGPPVQPPAGPPVQPPASGLPLYPPASQGPSAPPGAPVVPPVWPDATLPPGNPIVPPAGPPAYDPPIYQPGPEIEDDPDPADPSGKPVSVPEPSILGLLSAGCAAALLQRRRARGRKQRAGGLCSRGGDEIEDDRP